MIGSRLKSLREGKNLTQKELSVFLKLTPGAIGLYEQGRRTPDCSTLCNLADFYNVSVDYILCRTEDKNNVVKESYLPEEIELFQILHEITNILSLKQTKYLSEVIEKALKFLNSKTDKTK